MKKIIFSIITVFLIISLLFAIGTFENQYRTKLTNQEGDSLFIESSLPLDRLADADSIAVLVHGFSSDHTSMWLLARALKRQGMETVLLDLTGHGFSDGVITFDNAQTTRLSHDISSLIDTLSDRDVRFENLVLIGHSMGARSIAQYLMTSNVAFKHIIFIGPEINIEKTSQSAFFTGESNMDEEIIDALNSHTPRAPLTIITSNLDDIQPPEQAKKLISAIDEREGSSQAYKRQLIILQNILHNYETFSSNLADTVAKELKLGSINKWPFMVFYILTLIIILMPFLWQKAEGFKLKPESVPISLKRYFLYWLLSLPAAVILVGFVMLTPLKKPFFSVQFVVIIGGLGLVVLLMDKGIRQLLIRKSAETEPSKGILPMILLVGLSYTARYMGIGLSLRNIDLILCYILFTLLMYVGIFVLKNIELQGAENGLGRLLAFFLRYFPFLLFLIVFTILGSLSGITTSIQGLFVLLYSINAGNVVEGYTKSRKMNALTVALILSLPFGALF